ncbi:prolyl oligopeptidase family serine peptidase [Bosea sp. 2KB_26]|uniref:S9 family peptidase n=1 Tax=Bosea sp. 2KB_26 TaxID=3237475 RepID=UPI003F92BE62
MYEAANQIRIGIEPYLEVRSAKSPAIAPDGELLAYLSDESGTHQIWLRPLAGGAPWRLTDMQEPIGAISFNPKGRDLLFTMDCGGDERHQLWLVPGASGVPEPLTDDPTVVHAWGAWAPDGQRIAFTSNARDCEHMDVYVMDLATRTAKRVHQGSGYREAVAFFPDGKSLLVANATRSMSDQDLHRLDLETGALTPLLPHEGRARYVVSRMKKDGSGFFFVSDQGREHLGVAFCALAEGRVTWIVERKKQDIEAIALAPDQARLAYVANEEGWNRVFIRDLATGEEFEVSGLPRGTVGSVAWVPDGSGLVFPLDGATSSPDIWRFDVATRTARRLTDASKAGLDPSSFVEPSVERVASFDGLEIPFFVYRPRSKAPAGGYPVVVVVHGGPEAQWTPIFRADLQFFLSQGIMVVAPNVRGSTGYGRSYQHLDDKHLRMDSVADLKAVRLWLREQPEVDDERVAVYGRSYGGFMVLAALTEQPELWKVGVEFYGIANFLTMLETTGPWRRYLRAVEYGDLVADRDDLIRFSPIHKAGRIRAPLFIAQGLDDPRVPPGESEMIYSVLRGRGHPVEYVRIPHEGHGFARIENRRTVFGAVARFLRKHL